MLTNQERSQIKALLQSPQWKTVERLAEIMRDEIKEDSGLRSTEFETLKAIILSEGKRAGIRDFIQRLYSEAQ